VINLNNIKQLRLRDGIKQAALAYSLGVSQGTLFLGGKR